MEAGSAPARRTKRQVVRFLLAETPRNPPGVVNTALNRRGGFHLMIENDGHGPADILLGERAETARRIGGKRKRHLVASGIVGAGERRSAAKITPGNDWSAIDKVYAALAGRRLSFSMAPSPCLRRQHPAMGGERGGLRRIGIRILDPQKLELAACLNHRLGPIGIALARQLDDDFIVSLAIRRDEGLGQIPARQCAAESFPGTAPWSAAGLRIRPTAFIVSM